jgi:filamentous hemagglutinin family protein
MNRIHILFSSLFLYNLVLFNSIPAKAQITPDNTLGNEPSQINSNVLIKGSNADQINGGATRGINLFHSFSEFNIKDGQRVYFANPSGVLNILTRVTGKNASSIFGTLGVDGSANLFLMNPNGILFGKNASLDVQGSFIGTTANGLKFGNQGVFSATNPEAPALLTINPNALSFSQQQSGAITNQSQAPAGVSPNGNNTIGLRVPDGKSLLLVGGNVSVDGSGLRAYDGRIEVTGLAAPGDIGLNMTGDILSLNIPKDVTLADVFLSNESGVSVFGAVGGNIAINARNIDINSSSLFAGIAKGKGSPNTQAGDITLNATGNITLTGNASSIDNRVYENGSGNAGNIRISANSLTLKDKASLSTYTSGNGNAGSVFVQVNDAVTFENSNIFSTVEAGAVGNGGSVDIQTGSLSVTQGSEINSKTLGQGNAGNINIIARDLVSVDGFINTELSDGTQENFSSKITSAADPDSKGKAGNVQVKTGSLQLTNSAFISSSTFGNGHAGRVSIQAKDSVVLINNSSIFSNVGKGSEGNSGGVDIQAGSISLTQGSQINSKTLGQGNAGNINIISRDLVSVDGFVDTKLADGTQGKIYSRIINDVSKEGTGNAGDIKILTDSLRLTNGAFISNSTNGKGNGGNLTIDANNIKLDSDTFIDSTVDENAIGKGGNIRINTVNLSLMGGAKISTIVSGKGDGGDIFVNARNTIKLDGIVGNSIGGIRSGLINGGVGNGGDIQVTTGSLQITNGAKIDAGTNGEGNAGDITINARDIITIEGFAENSLSSNISSDVSSKGIGNAGNIRINTRELLLNNRGKISSSTFGQGNAGNIFIEASDILSLSNTKKIGFTQISSNVDSEAIGNAGIINIKTGNLSLDNAVITGFTFGKGNGGDINIQTEKLSLDNGSNFFTSTDGTGKAGNVSIQAKDSVSIANRSSISSEIGKEGVGNAGNIQILTDSFELVNGSSLNTSSVGKGNAGNILINTTSNTTVKDSNIATFTGTQGNAGKITILAEGDVSIFGKGGLFSFLYIDGMGSAGDIEIKGRNFSLSDGASLFSITVGKGNAGDILVNTTGNISFRNGSTINAATVGQGNAGNITVNAAGKVSFVGETADGLKFDTGIFSTVERDGEFIGKGKGGNINVSARDLSLNGAAISASNLVEGTGGDLDIKASNIRLDNKSAIASVTNSGDGGNINLTATDYLLLRRGSLISTTAGLQKFGGDGGNITINTPFIVGISKENSDISANAFSGKGGNVNIQTQNIFGIEARLKPTNQSDITASSEVGVQGEISIKKPDVDPNRGLVESPEVFKDKSDEIDQLCGRNGKPLGRFVVTGRGIIQPNPMDLMQGDIDFAQLATLDASNSIDKVNQLPDRLMVQSPANNQIVEAQAIVRGADGTLYLVAEAPNVIPRSRPGVSVCADVGKR